MAVKHIALVSVVTLSIGYASLAPAAPAAADLRRQDCAVLGHLTDAEASADAVVALLFEMQKTAAKESKENTAFKQQAAKAALAAKSDKLSQDNRAIDQGMKEAKEKADTQMSAATISLASGVAQGLIQIAGASSVYAKTPSDQQSVRLAGNATSLKSDLARLNADLKRGDRRISPGDVDKMKGELEKGLQNIRDAKKSARPC